MVNKILTYIIIIILITNCKFNQKNIELKQYPKQIGDTEFNAKMDNPNFRFCDTSNVLHRRSLIYYTGGHKNFEKDLINRYEYKKSYKTFSGYFIVRFGINCRNEIGRLRLESVNNEFEKAIPPKRLKEHIIEILRGLKKWNSPVINGKSFDGYKFIVIEFKNGEIIKS